MKTLHHRLSAVWFADVVGFTRQAAQDERRALRMIQSFQEAARETARRFDGRIVKFIGDAALAEFSRTESAVVAASRVHAACAEHAAADGVECPTLRIAVHVGDVATAEDGDLYGDGVNVAARIVREVAPGEVWVSEDVWRQLRHRPRFRFEPRGKRELKGVDPVEVYAVVGVTEEAARPAPAFGDRVRLWMRGSERHRLEAWPLGRRGVGLVIGVLALVLAAAAWFVFGPGRSSDGGTEAAVLDPSHVAVLYFDDHSEGQRLGHLADGLTEALIHDLAQVPELKVVSREGVKPFRDVAVPLDSIARAVGARTVIEGSVEESGDRVRVTAQLIDAADMTHLASIRVDRPRGELFELQDALVEEVSGQLRERLGTEIRRARSRRATSSVEAWELVQRANGLREQAGKASDATVDAALRREADSLLVRAERLDPRWVDPILLRGRIALDAGVPQQPGMPGDSIALKRGLAHAERGAAIASRDPRSLDLRGTIEHALAKQSSDSTRAAELLGKAERDLRTAVAEDASMASAWIALADLLYNSKYDLAPALEAARRAHEEDAFLIEQRQFEWLAEISLQLKDYDEALRWVEEGQRRYPGVSLIGIEMGILASEGGPAPDPARAWALVDEVGRASSPETRDLFVAVSRMQAAAILARAGLADSAVAVARRARASLPEDQQAWLDYDDAHLQLLLGRHEEAVDRLHNFLSALPEYRARLASDHWFEPLAGDARFEAIVDRGHLPIFCQILCEAP